MRSRGLQIDPIDFQRPAIEQRVDQGATTEEPYKAGFFQQYFPNIRNTIVDKYKSAIIGHTIKLEGGSKFTNIKEDRGGATKYGITLATLRRENPRATEADVRALTEEKAKQIYATTYWDKARVGDMPLRIQDVVFDGNVNHGVPNMTRILQQTLRDLGSKDIVVDGKIGNKTLNAINSYDDETLRTALLAKRQNFYEAIIENNPSQKKFEKGWFNRLEAVRKLNTKTMET